MQQSDFIMTMYTYNDNITIRQCLVNQAMFVSNTPRPKSFVLMFQWFWFSQSIERVFTQVVQKFNYSLKDFRVFFCPFGKMFQSLVFKNYFTHGSLSSCLLKSSNSSHVKEVTLPSSTFLIALSKRLKYSSFVSFNGKLLGSSSIEIKTRAFDLSVKKDLILKKASSSNSFA